LALGCFGGLGLYAVCMAFTEDLSVFLADFGVPISAGAASGLGILDMPSEMIADGVVMTTDYKVTCLASLFGDLQYGTGVNVDGLPYTVRNVELLDDGKFCDLMLQRSATPVLAAVSPAVLDGDGVETVSEVILDGGGPGTVYIDGNVLEGGAP
jgi:hypothetical protein